MAPESSGQPAQGILRRSFLGISGFLGMLGLLGARLFYVQAIDPSGRADKALAERRRQVVVPALRGEILDATGTVMARSIQRRRGMTFTKTEAKGAKEYLPSNSTVNRDMIDTVRPILNRARKVWGAKLPEIDWRALDGIRSIGVTAGASAPEVLVNEVIDAVRARYDVSVEIVETAQERVEFKVPRVLREAAQG